ncbi:putative N-acetyltransferase C9.02c [Tetrabaena socialis]|uniref:Putative N-acetyltransferase C9.02c n=1 Tax=Tetrabaena socialis TaxID=47790 RepID=A0A2J7ZW63_9CHLO|nr:putative N-acetyltransferase C9.02c [Tetrabaena socialis]|eukprot:PNH04495.1 putative N-acetyltransferase C9.02c [Tetrabaena socialis]
MADEREPSSSADAAPAEEAGDDAAPSAYCQPLGGAVFFGPVQPEQLDRIHALEAESYPEDEAATYDKLKFRIQNAADVFLVAMRSADGGGEAGAAGAVSDPEVVGYVCGTCTSAGRLTHESMAAHEPEGDLLCVHSVVVEAGLRRRGLATRLLRAYTAYVGASSPGLRGIRLICKQDLVRLYEGAGFTLVGPSSVVHGRDPWIEMAMQLGGSDDGEQ